MASPNAVLSVVETASRVTALPFGKTAGAEYVAGAPLAVCEVIEPQAPGLPQLTVQSTPPLLGSLATVALTVPDPPVTTESVDGATLTTIGRIVIVAFADIVGSVADVAKTVTVLPAGTAGKLNRSY